MVNNEAHILNNFYVIILKYVIANTSTSHISFSPLPLRTFYTSDYYLTTIELTLRLLPCLKCHVVLATSNTEFIVLFYILLRIFIIYFITLYYLCAI